MRNPSMPAHGVRTHAHGTAGPHLACPDCGQLPEPERKRRTLALVLAVLPVELAVHALVVGLHLPLVLKVLLLTVTATVLAIWVAEPSAARVLHRFLHAPELKKRREIEEAQALWRVRFSVPDRAGTLERVTHELAVLNANILVINVHPLGGENPAVLDELVLSAPASLAEEDITGALHNAGARHCKVWPTTPVALADAQTRSLGLAARIAAEPGSMPEVVAELLGARIATLEEAAETPRAEVLRLPTAWGEPLCVARPGEPFTPAESARAHRLAELAEAVHTVRAG